MPEINSLYLSWVLAGFAILVGFTALFSANSAKENVSKRLNEFVKSTVTQIEEDTDGLNDKINTLNNQINEQLNKLRIRDEDRKDEIADLKKELEKLRADLKKLDNRILPKYKR
ncbi:MAG: hypothetical protein HOL37_07790 [Rhodospirillaceae bacterium]|jgi:peptidoglycan hydrolase CwlO-like protein|nr:hypothetical protein [Rhodospirillaceae bacterium]MBT4464535.1 hypothetical protein [Rhodospirillaceae bacterium]MBT5014374.1 hypothetical protein [Rhodospirillaceae bacterium]MBT5309220.1 hypothetical protein [Rhodospirillaceae bacterium]MBT7355163.1 hypothetical protein [Rhodospirillaceae bacterium]